jgi:pantothenate kinase type III
MAFNAGGRHAGTLILPSIRVSRSQANSSAVRKDFETPIVSRFSCSVNTEKYVASPLVVTGFIYLRFG